MSDLTSKATVELLINGQQAQQTLAQLRQNALQLETAIAKAAAAGNKSDLKRLRKELADTKRQIREMESATQQVEQVLRHLDKATPRELNKSLQTLTRQLEYIERGSDAWKAHVEKIRRVKAELKEVNNELRDTEGFWSRFNRKLNDWQTSIMAGIAAMTGLVMAGRNAVKAFAEMEEELANTRKYTGMTEESVLKLNEAFKKMDTRTSREQLNALAQEAGRLGKNTLEDVQGYVEAADIINVALVDLGEGATQTIAKLTDIFGVSELMGTRDAMLAVGSTVNVLSQNCTASKPYLVQFAQRMAGVGAQADLTIPQLLAFGATLDANGQKVEMSASALGKLTMNLFQKPREIAKQVGLDVEVFTETLKKSTYEGLMMFLQRIQDLGSEDGLAVLAPMFKDLGLDGVRMSQVLSTLAEHLDMVKWETAEANKAFKEATSATNEYQIFNNTVQADLDKARKRIKELSVELGEKLLPVMRHVYTSTSLTLRFLSTTVSFISEHRVALLSLTAAIVAYTVAVNLSTIRLKAHNVMVALTTAASKAYAVVVTHLKTVHLALQVAMARLTGNLARENLLMGELRKNGAALTNVYTLLAAAVIAVGVAVIASMNKQSRAQKQLAEIEEEYNRRKLEHSDLSENERLSIEAAYYEAVRKQSEQSAKTTIEEEEALYNEVMAVQKQRYIDGQVSYQVYEEAIEQIEIRHLHTMASLYELGSKEHVQAQKNLQDKLLANQRKHQKEYEDAEKKHQDALAKVKEKHFGDNPAERRAKYEADLALLREVYHRELLAAGQNAKEKLRIEKAFQEARIALMEQYNIEGAELNKNFLRQWNEDVTAFLESDFGQAVSGSLDVLVSGMSSIFQQLTTIVQAELEIQTAGIEKKYEREISLAEGNNYKVRKLEKQKEKEIAKAKNEANKKMFAMQVIQAVAQTATNAINAYGSAAAIPLVGYILAPIAAASAIAAGMLQVAAIKKQQQASEAQGYVSGGFTRKGPKGEVAGVVHAGEWVASQELVNSPVARPILDALDYAQKTNTIGRLSPEDVSRTITAPHVLADSALRSQQVPQQVIVQNATESSDDNGLADTLRLLRDRLDEPFLTVNSVTGETGMKQAQDEYDKLIRNKTPKSRRS